MTVVYDLEHITTYRNPVTCEIDRINQTKAIPNIEVEDIDHLGIIAGIVDDIGIVEILNQ